MSESSSGDEGSELPEKPEHMVFYGEYGPQRQV